MAWSRAGHENARRIRDRAPASAQEVVLLECGHETSDVATVRFPSGRELYVCSGCDGRLREEKGARRRAPDDAD